MKTERAIVIEVYQAPDEERISTSFMPAYSVTVRKLDENLRPIEGENGLLHGLELPLNFAGDMKGQFGYPEINSIVRIGYDYDLEEYPYILNVSPNSLLIPELDEDEYVIFANESTFMKLNSRTNVVHIQAEEEFYTHAINYLNESEYVQFDSINFEVETDHNITFKAKKHMTLKALEMMSISATRLNLHSVSDSGFTFAGNHSETTAKTYRNVAGLGSSITSALPGSMWYGSPLVNLWVEVLTALTQVSTALTSLATHGHSALGAPPVDPTIIATAQLAISGVITKMTAIVAPTPLVAPT